MGNKKTQLLKVSSDKRFLVREDGSPFFWLADTAWELFHKLNREEACTYLENRAQKGFNVVQAVALAELEGLDVANAYGRKPLLANDKGEYDPTMPDTTVSAGAEYSYWNHVDFIIQKAEELGLYIALLPTWGDKYNLMWGKGPVIFNETNARVYGKWIGERYKNKTNIIWVLGGDRPLHTAMHFSVINEMAAGIKEGDGGRHLITFHPRGCASSSENVHNESWLDFNMIQSGHNAATNPYFEPNYKRVNDDYNRTLIKPVIDAEPRYEDHPIDFTSKNGFFDDYDTRVVAYWAVFSGACGHTYGHHSIWSMTTDPGEYFIMNWRAALDRPGAGQMQHVKALVESRTFMQGIPDQSLIVNNYEGYNHLRAMRGKDFAFIYDPNGLRFSVQMGIITGEKVRAYWYDPRTGGIRNAGEYDNSGVVEFMPPTSGRNNDWVLVVDDAAANYGEPGKK